MDPTPVDPTPADRPSGDTTSSPWTAFLAKVDLTKLVWIQINGFVMQRKQCCLCAPAPWQRSPKA